MFKMRAGDARARGIRQRGQTFANMASGLGNMVGGAMLQNRERERQQPMQDLNMRLGEARLETHEAQMGDRETARVKGEETKAKREQLISILSEHYKDPIGTMEALKAAGMVEELNDYYQNHLALREQIAKTTKAEKIEVSSAARLSSETISGLLRLDGSARDAQYPMSRSLIIAQRPDLEPELPESPDEETYAFLKDAAVASRTFADQAAMDTAEFKKIDNWWKLQDQKDKKGQDVFGNAVKRLSAAGKKAWTGEVEFQRRRIEKFAPDRLDTFDALTSGGHSVKTKTALKEWAGEGKDFSGEYGNYRMFAEESGETPIGPLEFAQALAKAKKPEEVDEKDTLRPSEALSVLRYVDSLAKARKESEVEYFDVPLETLRQNIADEKGYDLGHLEALSVGKGTDVSDFSSMSDDEFQALIGKQGEMTAEQREAAAKEWDRRFKQ